MYMDFSVAVYDKTCTTKGHLFTRGKIQLQSANVTPAGQSCSSRFTALVLHNTKNCGDESAGINDAGIVVPCLQHGPSDCCIVDETHPQYKGECYRYIIKAPNAVSVDKTPTPIDSISTA